MNVSALHPSQFRQFSHSIYVINNFWPAFASSVCRKSIKQYFTTDCSIFSPIRNNINYYEHQVMKIFKIHNRAIVVAIVTVTFPPRGPRKIKCNTVEILHSVESPGG